MRFSQCCHFALLAAFSLGCDGVSAQTASSMTKETPVQMTVGEIVLDALFYDNATMRALIA